MLHIGAIFYSRNNCSLMLKRIEINSVNIFDETDSTRYVLPHRRRPACALNGPPHFPMKKKACQTSTPLHP